MELMEAITSALFTVLVALVGYIAQKTANWIKEKGLTEKMNKKKYLIEIAVNAVEQIYSNNDGETKKEKAKLIAIKLLNESGLHVTETELNSFIEASVLEINKAFKADKFSKLEKENETQAEWVESPLDPDENALLNG